MAGMATLLDAQYAYWLGSTRVSAVIDGDPLNSWRVGAFRQMDQSRLRNKPIDKPLDNVNAGTVNADFFGDVRRAGSFRISIKSEQVKGGWEKSATCRDASSSIESSDRIIVMMPVSEDVESWVGFERNGKGKGHFCDEDRDLLHYAVRPLRGFHRQLLLHHGVFVADKPLTNSERRVLNELLTEKTEKEIARELALSPSTVHTYCVRICKKFGVRGRAGLVALWLA
jgi:DNA-binding CsgD family transcriptional regulator